MTGGVVEPLEPVHVDEGDDHPLVGRTESPAHLAGQDHHAVPAPVHPGQLVHGGFLLQLPEALEREVEVGQGPGGDLGAQAAQLARIDSQSLRQRVTNRAGGMVPPLLASQLCLADGPRDVRVARQPMHPRSTPTLSTPSAALERRGK